MSKINKNRQILATNKQKVSSTFEIIIPAEWNENIFDRNNFKKGYGYYMKQLVDTATFCETKVKCKRLLRATKEYATVDMCCTRYGCTRNYRVIVQRQREKNRPTNCTVMVTGEINHSHLKMAQKRISAELQTINSIKSKLLVNSSKLKPANNRKLETTKSNKLKLVRSSKLKLSRNKLLVWPAKKYSFLRIGKLSPKKRKPPEKVPEIKATLNGSVIVAHLDCRRLSYRNEIVYNYTLAIKFQQNERFPFAERMSSQHDEDSIYNWLYKFRQMCEVKNCWPPFNVVISDFDTIIMSAIMRAFNSCTLNEYINLMHALVTRGAGGCDGRGVHPSIDKIIILKCGKVNFQQNIAENIAKNVHSAHVKQCIKKMVSCLYNESNYNNVKAWFRDFSMLLSSKADDSRTQKIKKRICVTIMAMEDCQNMQNLDQYLAPANVVGKCGYLCKGNQFRNDFNAIFTETRRMRTTKTNPQSVENIFHCEEFLKIFTKSYAPYMPLWTALIFKEHPNNGEIANILFVDALMLGHGKVRIGRALRMLKNKTTWLYDKSAHTNRNTAPPASQVVPQTRQVALQATQNAWNCIASAKVKNTTSLTEADLASVRASIANIKILNEKATATNLAIPSLAISSSPIPSSPISSSPNLCLGISTSRDPSLLTPSTATTCLAIPRSPSTYLTLPSSPNSSLETPNSPNSCLATSSSPNSCLAISSPPNSCLANSSSLNSCLATSSSSNSCLAIPNSPSICLSIPRPINTNLANISLTSANKKKSTFILKRKLSQTPTKSSLLLSAVDDEDTFDLWKSTNFSFPRLKKIISPVLNEPINYYVIRAEGVILKYFDFDSLLSTPQKRSNNKNLYLHVQHIDFFTTIFARSAKIDGFQIFESYIGEHYIWSQLQNRDEKSQLELMRNYPVFNYIKESVLFIPICHKSHWCLAIAYFDTLQIAFYDPMIKVKSYTERIASEFRRAFAKFLDLYNRVVMKNLYLVRTGMWRIIPTVYPQYQQDNYNCGCFILNCIEERLNLRPPNHRFHPMQYRKYLAITALEFGDPYDFSLNPYMHHYCLYCSKEIRVNASVGVADDWSHDADFDEPASVWLSCIFCNYLVHVECAFKHHNVNPDYRWRNDFVCLLCES